MGGDGEVLGKLADVEEMRKGLWGGPWVVPSDMGLSPPAAGCDRTRHLQTETRSTFCDRRPG
jgi:hypothetical protein